MLFHLPYKITYLVYAIVLRPHRQLDRFHVAQLGQINARKPGLLWEPNAHGWVSLVARLPRLVLGRTKIILMAQMARCTQLLCWDK